MDRSSFEDAKANLSDSTDTVWGNVSSPVDHAAGVGRAEEELDDALERVAHGATVTVPSKLFERGLTFLFTVILTNGFAAGSYGLFVLAQRLQEYLSNFALGFGSGLSRFLPTASPAERDVFVTFASLLLVGVATVLGVAFYVTAPLIAQVADEGPQFELFVRIFAAGLPAGTWLYTVVEILRGLEEVGPLNLAFRVGFPAATVVVAGLGTFVFHDLVLVAIGVVVAPGVVGLAVAAWLVRERGFRPRLRGAGASRLRSRYLGFTGPLFLVRFATTTQAYGFYPLIAFFLSGVAGGVFVVGTIVGSFVQLPLGGINQFIAPVFAALHEEDQREALGRLYQVTSRLVLVFVTGLAIPLVVYREAVMGLFGPTFVRYAPLLPGFVLGHYAASAMGSVAILLKMTDHQRAFLGVNVVTTAFLVVAAVALTATYGLPGLVASYVLMLAVNNGLELAALYYLEGLQPFTRLHAKPLVAAVPLLLVTLAGRSLLPGATAPLLGTLVGLVAYAGMLNVLGFERVERRLVTSLLARYGGTVPGFGRVRISPQFEGPDGLFVVVGVAVLVGGFVQALLTGTLLPVSVGNGPPSVGLLQLCAVLGGVLFLVVGFVSATPESHRLERALWTLVVVAALLVVAVAAVLVVV